VTSRSDNLRKPLFRQPPGKFGCCLLGLPMGHEFTSLILALLRVRLLKVRRPRTIRALDGD
jgi:alkyl hydroperoxide reductase subunit AhpF